MSPDSERAQAGSRTDEVAGSPPIWPVRWGLLRLVECRIALWPKTEGASAMAVLNKRYRRSMLAWVLAAVALAVILVALDPFPGDPVAWSLPTVAAVPAVAALLVVLVVPLFGENPEARRICSEDYATLAAFSSTVGTLRTEYQWTLEPRHGLMVYALFHDLMNRDQPPRGHSDARHRERAVDRLARTRRRLVAETGTAES